MLNMLYTLDSTQVLICLSLELCIIREALEENTFSIVWRALSIAAPAINTINTADNIYANSIGESWCCAL